MIEAAVEVGFADLSVKRVADRLGVGPTALYHHVANLHDLHVAAGEHVMSGLELPQGAPSARAYLEELARSLRSLERRHPGIGAFCASGDPDAVTTQVTIEAAAQGLAELDIAVPDAMMLTAITANFAFSFATTERAESRSAAPATDELFEWVMGNTIDALLSDRANAPWNRPDGTIAYHGPPPTAAAN